MLVYDVTSNKSFEVVENLDWLPLFEVRLCVLIYIDIFVYMFPLFSLVILLQKDCW